MADILPFRGVRYQTAKVGADLSAVCAPPYDVISPAEQAALYERHPQNVVRLILGRESEKYAHASALFVDWLRTGILRDDAPSVYVYRQSFNDPVTGTPMPERIGLVCLLKLEEYASGKVLPHENTLTAAKADRLELLRATEAQFESIYGLYSDPDNAVQNFLREFDDREPVIENVPEMIGSSHRIERIGDAGAVAALTELLRDKQIFIADGHHRYETALNYRREARSANPHVSLTTPIAADYILITLTAFEDEGLLVLPTHRLVRGISVQTITDLKTRLSPQFTVTAADPATLSAEIVAQAAAGRKAFGLILPQNQTYLAILNASDTEIPMLVPGSLSDASKRLDVTLLHSLILEQHLGITAEALAAGEQVAYTRDESEAVRRVASGEFQAAFLLGRPSVQEVRDVSLAGDKMPQKSTFFFPKLLSGLLLRDLRRDDPKTALLD